MTDIPANLDASTGNPEDPFVAAPALLTPQTVAPEFGAEVPPNGPRQDMYAVDELAGGPVDDRAGDPASFTGGDFERGLGGQANPPERGDVEGAAVLGQRIGL